MTSIAVPEPFISPGPIFLQPIYITRTLFDCDSSNIEYAYQASVNTNKPFRVVRTDGTIIFQRDSANGIFCSGECLSFSDFVRPIRNTSDGAKLFLQHYDDNIDGQRHILVYSLCGELPTDIFDFALFNQSIVELFPNPSSNTINFKINLRDNLHRYELIILDNNAKEVSRQKIGSQNSYTLDVSNLSSGNYYYSLYASDKPYQTGKFVITK